MQHYQRPGIVVLKGEEAIEVLEEYINELREGKAEELTANQTEAMIKLATGLISAIDEETTILEPPKQSQLVPKLKNLIIKHILQEPKEPSSPVLPESPDSNTRVAHYHPPPITQQIR